MFTMKYILKNVMSGVGVLALALIFLMVSFLYSQQEHEKIVEEVSVDWWQVPVFAVDKSGNPVTDLEQGDIQVQLNGRQIPGFTLHKRSFSVIKREKEKKDEMPAAKQPPIQKNKVLFFLFDRSLSSETSIKRAKNIAKKIVAEAVEDVRFVVLTIDAFAGLVYVGEGSGSNKDRLLKLLEKEVKEKQNKRIVDPSEIMVNIETAKIGGSKYSEGDTVLFKENISKYYKRKSMGFFYSFEAFYFFLNSIADNKFIYFFTEGMSNSILASGGSLAGNRGMYYYYFRQLADYLSRSGALVFIINTMGVDQYHSNVTQTQLTENTAATISELPGEDSLRFLTRESGGAYLEGTHGKIVERLENMHRAYYEISFPDLPQLKGTARKVSIKSKRKDIKIHSLHALEKRKHYTQMNPVEKEILVVNLVTQPDNSLIKSTISAYNARVDKTKKSKNHLTYTVTLPPGYLQQHIDLYKVWLAVNDQGMARLEKMEKESLYPQKNRIKIQFQFPGSKKQKEKEEEIAGETRAYFVLVNRGTKPACAAVHGIELYQEDPLLLELEKKKTSAKAKKSGQSISAEEMNHILQGAADYCQRLKQSAFHFYCREKIVETRIPLSEGRIKKLNVENLDIDEARLTTRPRYGIVRAPSRRIYTQVKSYLFGYRLIKQGNKINEERDWISSSNNMKVHRDQVVKTNTFFSEKGVFAPITILDRTRQDKYNFQFIRFDERNSRRVAVIEALPKSPMETATIYGTLWIDREDFSLLKIEANPESIRNYRLLKDLALKLRTRLHLSLEIDFDWQQKGIRFPTKVSFLEKYKGGRIISMYRGPSGWERTRAQFTYSDYQFFSVQTEVSVQKADQSVNQ
jgi:VWFA-related protein